METARTSYRICFFSNSQEVTIIVWAAICSETARLYEKLQPNRLMVHAPVRQANIGICSPPLLPAFLVDSWPKVKIRLDGGKNNVISPPLDLSHADIPAGTRDEPTFPWEDKSNLNRILACIEMKSIFYDDWSLKERVKLKSIFLAALLCSLSWNAVVLKSPVIISPTSHPSFISPPKTPCEVV